MQWSVPLPSKDEPFITQSVSLSGTSYLLTFDWNSRTDRWTVSVATEDNVPIITGALLQVGIDLLRTIPTTFDYVPPGQLVLGGNNDPTLETIGDCTLFYLT